MIIQLQQKASVYWILSGYDIEFRLVCLFLYEVTRHRTSYPCGGNVICSKSNIKGVMDKKV